MKKLLVVEDEKIIRDNIKEYFEINDFLVKSAQNGIEALAIIQNFKPDIIISDMMMPEMDGMLLLEKLRENKSTNLIPFLMLTARVDKIDHRKSMNLGADDYIAKPFDFLDLYNAVQSLLKKNSNVKKHIAEESISSLQHWRHVANHELFTPINVLQNIINVIKIDTAIDTEIENIFNVSLRRLKKTLKNLLVISGVQELNTNFVHYSPEYLFEFINDTISDNLNYTNKSLTIHKNFNIPSEFYCREYSMIVLSELIENAVKFSDENSELTIDIELLDSNISLSITNYCSNLPPDLSNRVKPFYQHDRMNSEQQGLGLGLYLVNTLVDKYNDKFTVDVNNKEVKFTWICQSNH
jgi:CheY-like chemotaxis protein/anti-sigma regulatory factor (Ser/Thr protein kinase)